MLWEMAPTKAEMMTAGVAGKIKDAGLIATYFTAGAWLTSHEKTVHEFLVDVPQECAAYTSVGIHPVCAVDLLMPGDAGLDDIAKAVSAGWRDFGLRGLNAADLGGAPPFLTEHCRCRDTFFRCHGCILRLTVGRAHSRLHSILTTGPGLAGWMSTQEHVTLSTECKQSPSVDVFCCIISTGYIFLQLILPIYVGLLFLSSNWRCAVSAVLELVFLADISLQVPSTDTTGRVADWGIGWDGALQGTRVQCGGMFYSAQMTIRRHSLGCLRSFELDCSLDYAVRLRLKLGHRLSKTINLRLLLLFSLLLAVQFPRTGGKHLAFTAVKLLHLKIAR